MKNTKDLERRMKQLTRERDARKRDFFGTSDRTRDMAGSVQNGFYLGQLALSAFRNLTNYHISPGKRARRVVWSLGSVYFLNMLRKKLLRTRKPSGS